MDEIDKQLKQIRQTLQDYADKKAFLSPDEIQNLLKSFSELLLKKKETIKESKFNNIFESIMNKFN